ncbi:MAG: gliding motility-associated C-terminal domain-containing protein [Bacteroidota bacterium]
MLNLIILKVRLIIAFLFISFAVNAQRIFWTERFNDRIAFSSDIFLDNTSVFRSSNIPDVQHIEVDQFSGFIAITINGGEGLYRLDLSDGSNLTEIRDFGTFTGFNNVDVNFDDGLIYATELNGGLYYFDITGPFPNSGTEAILAGAPGSNGDDFGDVMYYSPNNRFYYVNLNEGDTYVTGGPFGATAIGGFQGDAPDLLTYDENTDLLYFVEGDRLFRSSLSFGTSVELFDAGTQIFDIAFYSRVGLYFVTSNNIFLYDVSDGSVTTLLNIPGAGIRGIGIERDLTPPTLSAIEPFDGQTGVTLGINAIRMDFNEDVQESITAASGTDVQVRIFREGSLFQAINRSSINFIGTEAQIPTNALLPGEYYVQIGGNVISNLSRLDYSGISSTTEWNFSIPCNNPTLAPSAGNTSNITSSTVDLGWTNGNGNARLVVLKEGSAVDFTPTDLTDYGAGDTDFGVEDLSGGNFLINNTTSSTTSISNLTPSTTYFYSIFEFDNNTNCYGPALTGSFTTLCEDPTGQVSGMTLDGVGANTVSFSYAAGNGTGRIVIAKEAASFGATALPVDQTNYAGSAVFGDGDALDDGFVAYVGTDLTFTVEGLTPLTTYSFAVFEFNDVGGICYNTAGTVGNTLTQTTGPAPEPLEHVSGFSVSNIDQTTVDLSWSESVNPQLADGYLIQAIANGSPSPAVIDGVVQPDDNDLSDGVGAANEAAGTTSFQFTGLVPGTEYTFSIYSFTNNGVNIDYKTDGSVPEQTATTLTSTDSDIVAPIIPVPTDIDYTTFLGNDATTSSLQLGSFQIRDGGSITDDDPVPTVVSQITFSLSNSTNLSRIALYDGSTELGEEAAAPSVTFNALSLSVPDNSSVDIDVYVTFNASVTESEVMQLTVTNVSSLSGTSRFTTADAGGASISSGPIEVTANSITVAQEPSSAVDQYTVLPQQPIFEAVDANGNLDIDFNESYTVETDNTDNLLPTNAIAVWSNGVLDFTGTGFNFEGVGNSTMNIETSPSGIVSDNTIVITVSGTPPVINNASSTDDTACTGGNGTISLADADISPGSLVDYTFDLLDDTPASVGSPGPLFEDLEAGNYTVIATNNNSGISSAPFAVTITENLPVINGTLSSSTPSICEGENANLSVNIPDGSDPFVLQISDGGNITTINDYISDDLISFSPTVGTTLYTVISLTDADGCTGSVSGVASINVNPIPILQVVPTASSACNPFNGELDLTVSGAGTVNYDITGEENFNFDAPSTQIFIGLAPGDYTVTATDIATLCTSAPFNVTIDDTSDRPSVDAGEATLVCEGDGVSLTATPSGGDGNYTFLWDNASTLDNPTAQSPVVSPTVTTTYGVTVTDGFGCESDQSFVLVTVSPEFESVTLNNAGATTICEGESTTLEAVMLGGTGPYDFTLSDGTNVNDYVSGSPITVSPTSTTTYTISSIQDDFSCSVGSINGSITVTVDQAPSQATVGADDTTCDPTYPDLSGNIPAVGTGLWTTTSSANIANPASPTTGVSNLPFGTSEFTWTITNGVCTESNNSTISITRTPPPSGTGVIQGETELCSDAQNVTYTLSGIADASEYTWRLPSGFSANSLVTTQPSITVNLDNGQAGIVKVVPSNDCGDVEVTVLNVSIIQAAEVTIIVPEELKPGQEIPFTFSTTVGLSQTNWSFGDGGSSTSANPVHVYDQAGNYTVELVFQNDDGCTGTTSLAITVVPRETVSIKNAITPNGDGQNDFLTVEGILDYPDNKVTLFDRWGVEVASFNGYTNDWDLIISGDYIPAGNYICIVELPEIGETVKRSVTVIKGD